MAREAYSTFENDKLSMQNNPFNWPVTESFQGRDAAGRIYNISRRQPGTEIHQFAGGESATSMASDYEILTTDCGEILNELSNGQFVTVASDGAGRTISRIKRA